MLRSLCVVAACGLAAVSDLHAQEVLELPQCDRLLAGYDALLVPAKQARLVQIGACYQRYADAAINRGYREIDTRVTAWESSARLTVRTEIAAKAATAVALLSSEQRMELAELEQRYEEEARQIQIEATAQNRQATNIRRNELLTSTREQRAGLSARHQSDSAALQGSIRAAYLKADEEIAKLVDPDRMSLAQQHQDKLRYSGDKFGSFASAAFDQSIKDYEAGRLIGKIVAVEGRAVIVNSSREEREATVGGAVHLGDTVRTEHAAKVSIVFDDDTSVEIAERASLTLDRFVYNPESHDRGPSLLNSLFSYLSGLLGEERGEPDKAINIPYGNIGIRG